MTTHCTKETKITICEMVRVFEITINDRLEETIDVFSRFNSKRSLLLVYFFRFIIDLQVYSNHRQ